MSQPGMPGTFGQTADHGGELLRANRGFSMRDSQLLVRQVLDHAAHLLPDQGPIEVFIHHNTLHSFENLPFHDAVRQAGCLHQARSYLNESEYQEMFRAGRINQADLAEARIQLGWPVSEEPLVAGLSVAQLEEALLHSPVPRIALASRAWWMGNRHTEPARAIALWRAILDLPWPTVSLEKPSHLAPGELAWHVCGLPLITATRSCLIPFCASYLDRGMAGQYDHRAERFWSYFLEQVARGNILEPYGHALAADALKRLCSRQDSATAVLELLGLAKKTSSGDEVDTQNLESLVVSALLRHPGWAGMFHRLELHPEERPNHAMPVHLTDFLAATLLVEYHLALHVACLEGVIPAESPAAPRELVAALCRHLSARPAGPALRSESWDLAMALLGQGLGAQEIKAWSLAGQKKMVEATIAFSRPRRLALWQEALEANLRSQLLRAMAARPRSLGHNTPAKPELDLMTCIDDREESFRRAMEELHPSSRTWGAPGFFGLPISWQDAGSRGTRTLCPLGVQPAHTVRERPTCERTALLMRRNASFTNMARYTETNLRGTFGGALLGTLTAITAFPLMVLGLFFPRWREVANRLVARLGVDGSATRLHFEEGGSTAEIVSGALAFPVAEQAARVGGLLRTIGMTGDMAPLVVVLGHGSSSANNPHKSAYDCGACGGHEGHNNARLITMLANRPEVRRELVMQGLTIPDTTWFVGGRHDTCSDTVELLDTDRVPATHQAHLAKAVIWLREAARAGAAERCRRFRSAPRRPSPGVAHRHVRERSVDPAQPRPELGHATNAMAIIGRREATRGLFLDRRAFLISYDSHQDQHGAILAAILAAITPVCVGINLEYYFSRIDFNRYGSGTKLPHNPVGLIGVMEGACGDLRTGLPRQMVEIHTPVRLAMLVESPVRQLLDAVRGNSDLHRKVSNQWFTLICQEPDSRRQWLVDPDLEIHEIRHAPGELAAVPSFADSRACYSAGMDDLPLAWIAPLTGAGQ